MRRDPDDPISDATWETVAETIAGRPLPAVRRRRQQWRVVLVVLVMVAIVGGVFVGVWSGPEIDLHTEPRDGAWGTVGAVCLVASLVAWVAAIVWLLRRDAFPPLGNDPTSGLRARERRAIDRMARGVTARPDGRTDVLRAVAERRRRDTTVSVALAPGFLLLWCGNLLTTTWSTLTAVQAVALVFFAVVLALALRWRAQYRAFVERNPPRAEREPEPAG
ncbi:hypothetical protein [Curtobacterium sp. ER1/6]|uniref:hypothetical protein n=1 Tax=Curtobacterium sp. ER1/6 TaxID=1891920 RepID=UPI00084FB13A|nr:hypothetical protein [Curtobacterium sp. ER1/6]OEI68375.1 hypothetical protein Cus16_2046 [Curtobacterium sp. ER1/6]